MDNKYRWGQKVKIASIKEDSEYAEELAKLVGQEGTVAEIRMTEGEFIYTLKSDNEALEEYFWCESELESAE